MSPRLRPALKLTLFWWDVAPVCLQVFVGFLLYHDPPPYARRVIRTVAALSAVFQVGPTALRIEFPACSALLLAAWLPAAHTCCIPSAAMRQPRSPARHVRRCGNSARLHGPLPIPLRPSSLQRLVIYSFPAICWAYGAGALFSGFVSLVFWAG